MTSPRAAARFPTTLLMLAGISLSVVLIWLRNHDILRDMFDYSTVVTAAGKVEAGFLPYVGTRSPMQSSTYLLNYWTEQLFGRNYLALTWGGLMQALGGAWVLQWLLRKSWGAVSAGLVALAVAMAGLIQHVVFFYNPIGILCLGIVVLGLAADPDLWPLHTLRRWAVVGALVLGGMNKLNFHGATLVLGGLLTVAACAGNRSGRGACIRTLLILGVVGLIVPIAGELAWTGASFAQWWADVVVLPEARHEALGRIFSPAIYLRPAYGFHHHILFRPIGGLGLLLLLGVGGWTFRDAWRAGVERTELACIVLFVAASAILCALLMITNHETVMLTSLSYVLAGTALHLRYRHADDRVRGNVVLAGLLVWALGGGYAAWHGSRVLYAPRPPLRRDYVRLQSPAPALAYFRGVRMLPEQIDALERIAAKLQSLETKPGHLPPILFGPALEWLERYYTDAIIWRAPIWYDAGTSLGASDEGYFRGLLAGSYRRLLTHRAWQAWPPAVWEILNREYRMEKIGSRDVLYHPRSRAPMPAVGPAIPAMPTPAEYRSGAGGNLFISATRFSANLGLKTMAGRGLFGATSDSLWSWPQGARELRGETVARLQPAGGEATVIFRVIADNPRSGELLWETAATLDSSRAEAVIPFSLQPGDRPLWLQTEVQGRSEVALGGWRDLTITYAGKGTGAPALPFNRDLDARPAGGEAANGELVFTRSANAPDASGWTVIPVENWREYASAHRVRINFAFEANRARQSEPVDVVLAWYRAGRFEILTQKMIDVRAPSPLKWEAGLPEPEGWVGLLARSGEGPGPGHRLRILSWETE